MLGTYTLVPPLMWSQGGGWVSVVVCCLYGRYMTCERVLMVSVGLLGLGGLLARGLHAGTPHRICDNWLLCL